MLAGTWRRDRAWIALSVVGLVVLIAAPAIMPPFFVRVGQLLLFSAGLGIAWAILGGLAGYWSFGHTAFIGIGAFAAALFEVNAGLSPALGFGLGLLVGPAACALVAGVLAYPILRLRGIYFAIAMLGVSQVFAELNNNVDLFEGSMGLTLPQVGPAGIEPEMFFYYVFLAAASLTLLIAYLIKSSRFGYGLLSIREDEDTARMLGVPTEHYKAIVFVISAVLTGLLGVIYAHSLGYITTGSVYRTDNSLNMIVYSLLGGMGTLIGPIVGASVMVVLTQVILGRLLEIHMFLTGALLVILVMVAPMGLVGLARRLVGRAFGRTPQ
jgi:branched-chain amino acid transport system permease protein